MSRLVRRPVTIFSFAFLLLAFPIWWTLRSARVEASLAPAALLALSEPTPPPPEFRVMLLRSGLRPEALAAAGVAPSLIADSLQAVLALTSAPASLADSDAAFANARRAADRLERLIQSGKGTQEDVAAYQVAKASLANATAQREAVLDSVFVAATANLSSAQRTALANARANRAWNLPPEFLVVNRDQAEWVALRDALANERISAKLHEDPDSAAQAQLANWRATPTVAAARMALETNLPQIRSNWNSAAGD